MVVTPFYYRGTTDGWPGNPTLQRQGMTCCTIDPFVATLFAILCRNHGRAVVLASRQSKHRALIGPTNHFDNIEASVNLLLSPIEFARKADVQLPVEFAMGYLRDIGITELPERISSNLELHEILHLTHNEGLRVSPLQLIHFQTLIMEHRND